MKKNIINYLLAFILPFIVLLLIFLCQNMVFQRTIFVSDMQGQYISLFQYLKNIPSSIDSIFYSFSKGLGGGMLGTIAYYLASPLNFLVYLFGKTNLNFALLSILLIKIGLCGLFMNLFLRKIFPRCSTKYCLLLSSCYALMSYNIAYYFHLMWLDGVYLIPLIMLGIVHITEGKSGLLYGITLFFAILSNYYIGYMICMFSFLFLLYNLLLQYQWKKDKKKILRIVIKFIIISILSASMTCFLLIPTILELMNTTKVTGNGIFQNIHISYNLFQTLQNMLFTNYGIDNILNDQNTPLIYFGIINVILVLFYFMNSGISKKEKFISFFFFLIFIFSFSISIINYIWHGFHAPNCFNYRYTFLFVFFCIYLSCKSIMHLKTVKKEVYLFSFLILEIMTLYSIIFVNNYFIYINLGLSVFYLLILYLSIHYPDKNQIKQFQILLVILVLSELFVNGFLTIRGYGLYSNQEYKDNLKVVSSKMKKLSPDNWSFYRIERDTRYTYLDSFFYQIPNASIFLSTVESSSYQFMKNVGIHMQSNSYQYSLGNTRLLDCILGIQYFITSESNYYDYKIVDQFKFSPFSQLLYDIKISKYQVFQNPYSLNIGFMISDQSLDFIKQLKNNQVLDHLSFQNIIAQTMIGEKIKIFKNIPYQKVNQDEYELQIMNSNDVYLSFYSNILGNDTMDIYINDKHYKELTEANQATLKIKNTYQVGDTITIKFVRKGNFVLENDIHPYYFDEGEFQKFYHKVKKDQLQIISFKNTNIEANIQVDKTPILFTSIPYDKGWRVYVDGKKKKTILLYDEFLGVKLKKGTHKIEFRYHPIGFNIGLIISSCSFVLFIFYFVLENKRKKCFKK